MTLISTNGDITNGNGSDVNVRGGSATLIAQQGFVGDTDGGEITIIVPLVEGEATITLVTNVGANLNPNFANVDQRLGSVQTPVEAGTAAAVGASVLAALEEIGFIDWAGFDPEVRLVDCLEPCIQLPADQLEDDGMAELRNPTKMLVIRTTTGTKIIPIYAEPLARNRSSADSTGYEAVLD